MLWAQVSYKIITNILRNQFVTIRLDRHFPFDGTSLVTFISFLMKFLNANRTASEAQPECHILLLFAFVPQKGHQVCRMNLILGIPLSAYLKAMVDIFGAAFCYAEICELYLVKYGRLKIEGNIQFICLYDFILYVPENNVSVMLE